MRVDKLTLAAFEATLRGPATPTALALAADPAALRARAGRLAARLAAQGIDAVAVGPRPTVGGGGAPGVVLPSAAVALPERVRRGAAGRARRRCSAGSSGAAACWTCGGARRGRREIRPRPCWRRRLSLHVVATAGHVDHGKSTLVRALTGMEPDRWAEERRRGMTIDLGFAWTTLARPAARSRSSTCQATSGS